LYTEDDKLNKQEDWKKSQEILERINKRKLYKLLAEDDLTGMMRSLN